MRAGHALDGVGGLGKETADGHQRGGNCSQPEFFPAGWECAFRRHSCGLKVDHGLLLVVVVWSRDGHCGAILRGDRAMAEKLYVATGCSTDELGKRRLTNTCAVPPPNPTGN